MRYAALVFFLYIFIFSLQDAWAGKRIGLIIGNGEYSQVVPLANPENDAALMAQTLKQVGFDIVMAQNADAAENAGSHSYIRAQVACVWTGHCGPVLLRRARSSGAGRELSHSSGIGHRGHR